MAPMQTPTPTLERPNRQQTDPHDQPPGGNGAPQHDHAADDHDLPTDLPKPSTFTVIIVMVVIALLLVALFLLGLIPHLHRIALAKSDADAVASDVPVVSVERPKPTSESKDLYFPADVRANQATAIFTRANGFLKKWNYDIQSRVKANTVLAVIDAPDIDAELEQAKANLAQARTTVAKSQSDLHLADVTLQRYIESQKASPGSVTQLAIDQQQATYDDAASALAQAKAAVASEQAAVDQFTVIQNFDQVVAPFDGVITARNYDNGALLSPTSSRELFDISQTDLLRVYVSVPQGDATAVQVGKPGYLQVPSNYPGKWFPGVVARTSDALDSGTRTLTVEVDFPNKDDSLRPGMFGQIRLPVGDARSVLMIPSGAVIFDAQGLQVALVQDNKIHLQKIGVGRDMGTSIEVTSGLSTSDQVVTNPGEKVAEGVTVKAVAEPTTKP
jgi:membrane fusion protein, multidrug efflux system